MELKPRIKYKKGYKYQLHEIYAIKTDITGYGAKTEYIELTVGGLLIIDAGYAWDGASGTTIDTKTSMRGSLVHDAFYQLIRMKLLPYSERCKVDDLFYKILQADGMNRIRAWFWRKSMYTIWAKAAARPKNAKKVIIAP